MPCQCFWASCHQTQIAKAGGIDNLVVTVMGYMISSCLSFPHASNFNEMIDLYLMFRIGVFLLAAYICFVVSLSFVVCCLFMGWLNCPFCVLAAVLTDLWLYFSLECYSHLGIMRFWWVSKKRAKWCCYVKKCLVSIINRPFSLSVQWSVVMSLRYLWKANTH